MTELVLLNCLTLIGFSFPGPQPLVVPWFLGAMVRVIIGSAITSVLIVTGLLISVPYSVCVGILGFLAVIGLSQYILECREVTPSVVLQRVAMVMVTQAGCVLITRWLNGTRSTADSYEYASLSGLIYSDKVELASTNLLEARMLGYSAINSLAGYGNELYVTAFSPMMGLLALIVAAAAFAHLLGFGVVVDAVSTLVKPKRIVLFGTVALGLSSGFYVWASMYVNSHTYVAALISAVFYLLVLEERTRTPMTLVALLVLAAAISLTRPEGYLLVLGVVICLLVSNIYSRERATVALFSSSLAMFVWWMSLGTRSDPAVGGLSNSGALGYALTPAVMSALVIAVSYFYRTCYPRLYDKWPLIILGAGLLILASLIVFRPEIGRPTVASWFHNYLIGEGLWGKIVVVILSVNIFTCVAESLRGYRHVLAVAPTLLIMNGGTAFIRDGGFRVGPGDSFNRMLVHIFPLMCASAVFSVVVLCLRIDRVGRQ